MAAIPQFDHGKVPGYRHRLWKIFQRLQEITWKKVFHFVSRRWDEKYYNTVSPLLLVRKKRTIGHVHPTIHGCEELIKDGSEINATRQRQYL